MTFVLFILNELSRYVYHNHKGDNISALYITYYAQTLSCKERQRQRKFIISSPIISLKRLQLNLYTIFYLTLFLSTAK